MQGTANDLVAFYVKSNVKLSSIVVLKLLAHASGLKVFKACCKTFHSRSQIFVVFVYKTSASLHRFFFLCVTCLIKKKREDLLRVLADR